MIFKVLKPIRHNGVLYLPGRHAGEEHADVQRVDLTGEIELSDFQAAQMTSGQIEKAVSSQPSAVSEKEPATKKKS